MAEVNLQMQDSAAVGSVCGAAAARLPRAGRGGGRHVFPEARVTTSRVGRRRQEPKRYSHGFAIAGDVRVKARRFNSCFSCVHKHI